MCDPEPVDSQKVVPHGSHRRHVSTVHFYQFFEISPLQWFFYRRHIVEYFEFFAGFVFWVFWNFIVVTKKKNIGLASILYRYLKRILLKSCRFQINRQSYFLKTAKINYIK